MNVEAAASACASVSNSMARNEKRQTPIPMMCVPVRAKLRLIAAPPPLRGETGCRRRRCLLCQRQGRRSHQRGEYSKADEPTHRNLPCIKNNQKRLSTISASPAPQAFPTRLWRVARGAQGLVFIVGAAPRRGPRFASWAGEEWQGMAPRARLGKTRQDSARPG